MSKPTIYEALKAKLGRDPTLFEINSECRRIIGKSADNDAPAEIIALHAKYDQETKKRNA